MFIVNEDGSLAVYQSLIGENVSGFTPQYLEQSYGRAYFRAVTSNFDGRAWFLTERELATSTTPETITAFTSDTLTAAYAFPTDTFTACTFAGTTLPTSSPQIETETIYWAVGVTATTFKIYLSQADAEAGENPILFSDAGTSATIEAFPLGTYVLIEQLSFDSEVDCAGFYPTPLLNTPTSTITGQPRFVGQDILMQGDGYGFETTVANGDVNFIAHGEARVISEAQYGFPIDVEMIPMPISLSMSGNPKSSNLMEKKHLRFATFLFADIIGGTITSGDTITPIAIKTLLDVPPGSPPVPTTGSFEMSIFGGWDDFNYNSFTINHREPFGIKLTGIFYTVDA